MTNLANDAPLLVSPDVWMAIPVDRRLAPIAVASASRSDLDALLVAAGIDPGGCRIGRGRLSSVEIVLDWDQVCCQTF